MMTRPLAVPIAMNFEWIATTVGDPGPYSLNSMFLRSWRLIASMGSTLTTPVVLLLEPSSLVLLSLRSLVLLVRRCARLRDRAVARKRRLTCSGEMSSTPTQLSS